MHFTMEHQVGISGGTESTTYMGAVSYLDQERCSLQFRHETLQYQFECHTSIKQMADYLVYKTQFIQRDGGGITRILNML